MTTFQPVWQHNIHFFVLNNVQHQSIFAWLHVLTYVILNTFHIPCLWTMALTCLPSKLSLFGHDIKALSIYFPVCNMKAMFRNEIEKVKTNQAIFWIGDHLQWFWSPMVASDGNISGIFCFLHNETNQIRREFVLTQVNQRTSRATFKLLALLKIKLLLGIE